MKAARFQLKNSSSDQRDSPVSCSLTVKETDFAAPFRADEQECCEKENTEGTLLFKADDLSETTWKVSSTQTLEEKNSICDLKVAAEVEKIAIKNNPISSSGCTTTMSLAKDDVMPSAMDDGSNISGPNLNDKIGQYPISILPVLPDVDLEQSTQLELK